MSDIYSSELIEHYKHPHNFGDLPEAVKSGRAVNSLCGDMVEIKIKEGVNNNVEEIRFRGVGCAVCTASASLLTDAVRGKTTDEIKGLDSNFVLKLIGADLTPARVKCALLPLEALLKAI